MMEMKPDHRPVALAGEVETANNGITVALVSDMRSGGAAMGGRHPLVIGASGDVNEVIVPCHRCGLADGKPGQFPRAGIAVVTVGGNPILGASGHGARHQKKGKSFDNLKS